MYDGLLTVLRANVGIMLTTAQVCARFGNVVLVKDCNKRTGCRADSIQGCEHDPAGFDVWRNPLAGHIAYRHLMAMYGAGLLTKTSRGDGLIVWGWAGPNDHDADGLEALWALPVNGDA